MLEAAERHLLDAAKARPAFGEAHNNLAAVYVGLGRWDQALAQVQLAQNSGFEVDARLKDDIAARRGQSVAIHGGSASVPPTAEPESKELAIDHVAVACVPSARYPRIEARLSPQNRVVQAKVFFRTEKSGWYAVGLRPEEDAHVANLPRPRSTRSFRYYLQATDEATGVTRTPEHEVIVVDDREQCGEKQSDFTTMASGILVEPPQGR